MPGHSRWVFLALWLVPLGGCVIVSHEHDRRSGRSPKSAEGAEHAGLAEEDVQTITLDATPRVRHRPETVTGVMTHSPGDDAPGVDVPLETPEDPEDGDVDAYADPHSKRPGAEEGESPPEPRAVAFVPPHPKLRPVRPGQRPFLAEPVALALVSVRDGQLCFSAEAVLELDDTLAKEPAIKSVVGLDSPVREEVGLTELAVLAHLSGRQLLLVDVQVAHEPSRRVGYLLHTKTATLLAHWTIRGPAGSTPASSGAAPDLCERLARSYARLTK